MLVEELSSLPCGRFYRTAEVFLHHSFGVGNRAQCKGLKVFRDITSKVLQRRFHNILIAQEMNEFSEARIVGTIMEAGYY